MGYWPIVYRLVEFGLLLVGQALSKARAKSVSGPTQKMSNRKKAPSKKHINDITGKPFAEWNSLPSRDHIKRIEWKLDPSWLL